MASHAPESPNMKLAAGTLLICVMLAITTTVDSSPIPQSSAWPSTASILGERATTEQRLERRFLGKLFSCFSCKKVYSPYQSPVHSERWREAQSYGDRPPLVETPTVNRTPEHFHYSDPYPAPLVPAVRD